MAGLWARAFASGVSRDAAVQMAKAVQFDRATRCATPYSLASVPAGMAVKQCTVGFTRKAPHPGLERASLWLGDDKRYTWLEVQPVEGRPGWKANLTIGGLPVLHAQGNWLFYEAPYAATLSGEGGQGKGPLSSDDAKALIAGFKPHGVPDDPTTW